MIFNDLSIFGFGKAVFRPRNIKTLVIFRHHKGLGRFECLADGQPTVSPWAIFFRASGARLADNISTRFVIIEKSRGTDERLKLLFQNTRLAGLKLVLLKELHGHGEIHRSKLRSF
jgi:hypothetical protein